MKKRIAIILAFCLAAASLTACADSSSGSRIRRNNCLKQIRIDGPDAAINSQEDDYKEIPDSSLTALNMYCQDPENGKTLIVTPTKDFDDWTGVLILISSNLDLTHAGPTGQKGR